MAENGSKDSASREDPVGDKTEAKKHDVLPKSVLDQITRPSGDAKRLSHVGKRPIPTLRSVISIIEHLESIHCHGRIRWQKPRRDEHIIGVQLEGSSAQIKQWLSRLRTISVAPISIND